MLTDFMPDLRLLVKRAPRALWNSKYELCRVYYGLGLDHLRMELKIKTENKY